MFKDEYQKLQEELCPSADLLEKTHNKAQHCERKSTHCLYRLRMPMALLAALCLCVVLVMPALAGRVDAVYQTLYAISPATAQFFMPVQRTDEDQGIKLEVLSAFVHENVAEVYISLQDLTGDRVDETTDLFDNYSIHQPFSSIAHCEMAGYDADTKTATFLITITQGEGQDITGDKITFSVGDFLSKKKKQQNLFIPIDLSTVGAAERTQTVFSNGGGGEIGRLEPEPLALVPGEANPVFPLEEIALSGIGYVEGKLQVQARLGDLRDKDNHGYFYLKSKSGEGGHRATHNFYFREETPAGPISYCTDVFDVTQSELGNYELYGDFWTSGLCTEGRWQVTFPLQTAP